MTDLLSTSFLFDINITNDSRVALFIGAGFTDNDIMKINNRITGWSHRQATDEIGNCMFSSWQKLDDTDQKPYM